MNNNKWKGDDIFKVTSTRSLRASKKTVVQFLRDSVANRNTIRPKELATRSPALWLIGWEETISQFAVVNVFKCLRWYEEEWDPSTCSASCGNYGIQRRLIQCMTHKNGENIKTDPMFCDQRSMPVYSRKCNRIPCTPPTTTSITISALDAEVGEALHQSTTNYVDESHQTTDMSLYV